MSKNFQFSNLKSDLLGKFSTFPIFSKISKFYPSRPNCAKFQRNQRHFFIHHSSSSFITTTRCARGSAGTGRYYTVRAKLGWVVHSASLLSKNYLLHKNNIQVVVFVINFVFWREFPPKSPDPEGSF